MAFPFPPAAATSEMAPLGVLSMTAKALVLGGGFLASCGEANAVSEPSNDLGGTATPVLPHDTEASNSPAPDPKVGADGASVDPSPDPGA